MEPRLTGNRQEGGTRLTGNRQEGGQGLDMVGAGGDMPVVNGGRVVPVTASIIYRQCASRCTCSRSTTSPINTYIFTHTHFLSNILCLLLQYSKSAPSLVELAFSHILHYFTQTQFGTNPEGWN